MYIIPLFSVVKYPAATYDPCILDKLQKLDDLSDKYSGYEI